MRVLAPFLATVASVFTIVAAVARIRWDALQPRVHNSTHTGREALPSWVKPVLTGWLLFIGGTITFVFVYVVIKTVVSLSA
jgi:hypothetical protein